MLGTAAPTPFVSTDDWKRLGERSKRIRLIAQDLTVTLGSGNWREWYNALVRCASQHTWWRPEWYIWNSAEDPSLPPNNDCAITAAGVMILKINTSNQDHLRRIDQTNPRAIFRRLYECHHDSDTTRQADLARKFYSPDSTMAGLKLDLRSFGVWILDLQDDYHQVAADAIPERQFVHTYLRGLSKEFEVLRYDLVHTRRYGTKDVDVPLAAVIDEVESFAKEHRLPLTGKKIHTNSSTVEQSTTSKRKPKKMCQAHMNGQQCQKGRLCADSHRPLTSGPDKHSGWTCGACGKKGHSKNWNQCPKYGKPRTTSKVDKQIKTLKSQLKAEQKKRTKAEAAAAQSSSSNTTLTRSAAKEKFSTLKAELKSLKSQTPAKDWEEMSNTFFSDLHEEDFFSDGED